jgi:hypothetical protein
MSDTALFILLSPTDEKYLAKPKTLSPTSHGNERGDKTFGEKPDNHVHLMLD